MAILVVLVAFATTGCSLMGEQGPYDFNPELKTLAIGSDYGAYRLTAKERSEDYGADVFLLTHRASGGQVAYVAADDDNKWFSAIFKTPASDDTGVNHILEHTVLEGSKRYPVKSPFTEMSKRSVNNFMNAMTGTDVTSYPIASENQKDFDNLMRVYLDAVFAPLVVENPLLLMQEGWRYEKAASADKATGKTAATAVDQASDLTVNGVVLNEMRGALSDRYDWVFTQIPAALYPDTYYRFNSGGDPLSIVDLTHEGLKAVHGRYYNPKNALLVFYGNLDLKEKLAYIDENYYSALGASAQDATDNSTDNTTDNTTEASTQSQSPKLSNLQAPFEGTNHLQLPFPATADERPETDSMLSWNRSISEVSLEDGVGLELLMTLLSDGYGTPLYDTLVGGEGQPEGQPLGMSLSGYVDTTYRQPMFHLLLEGASHRDMAAFEKVIQQQLQAVVEKGIDGDRVAGAINQYALSFRTAQGEANRGEYALYALELGFITHEEPLYALNSLQALEAIAKKAQAGNYFGDLISRTLLEKARTNTATVVFTPDAQLASGRDQALYAKVEARLKGLPKDGLSAISEGLAAYEAYQAAPETPEALATLPTLKVTDLDLKAPKYQQSEKQIEGATVLYDTVAAHGVTGIQLLFDLEGLGAEEFTLLPVLMRTLDLADTTLQSREVLDGAFNRTSGGLMVAPVYLQDSDNPAVAKAYLSVGIQFLDGSAPKVLPLVSEVLNQIDYGDHEALKAAVQMAITDTENLVGGEGDVLSRMYYQGALTASGAMALHDIEGGYQDLTALNDDLESDHKAAQALSERLEALSQKVFTRERVTISAAAEAKGLKTVKEPLKVLIKALPEVAEGTEGAGAVSDAGQWPPKLQAVEGSRFTGVAIASGMNYADVGFHLSAVDRKLKGQDLVLMQLLNDGYIYNRVRLAGGAYGGYMGIDGDNCVYFTAYRAPDYQVLLDAVKDLPNCLNLVSISQMEIDNAIVSVAGRFYQQGDVFSEVRQGLYGYLMPSSTDGNQLLKEMLDTNESDIKTLAEWLDRGLAKSQGVVAGPEAVLAKGPFDRVIHPLSVPKP